MELFTIEFSPKESFERKIEEETYIRFKEFLEDCEGVFIPFYIRVNVFFSLYYD